jgi:hypothetical protein
MKTDLPGRDEYYRLTRARELRQQAVLLCVVEGLVGLPVFGILFLAAAALPIVVPELWKARQLPLAILWSTILLVVIGVAATGFIRGIEWCETRRKQWWEEASRLEKEHQGRYGDLPPGQVPAGTWAGFDLIALFVLGQEPTHRHHRAQDDLTQAEGKAEPHRPG